MAAVLDRDPQGQPVRKAGVMGVVVDGGEVRAGDSIQNESIGIAYTLLLPV